MVCIWCYYFVVFSWLAFLFLVVRLRLIPILSCGVLGVSASVLFTASQWGFSRGYGILGVAHRLRRLLAVCVSGWSSVTLSIRWFIRCIALMRGAISWCIAIDTHAMYFPGMSCPGVALGLDVADDVMILYPFFHSWGLLECAFLGWLLCVFSYLWVAGRCLGVFDLWWNGMGRGSLLIVLSVLFPWWLPCLDFPSWKYLARMYCLFSSPFVFFSFFLPFPSCLSLLRLSLFLGVQVLVMLVVFPIRLYGVWCGSEEMLRLIAGVLLGRRCVWCRGWLFLRGGLTPPDFLKSAFFIIGRSFSFAT